MPQRRRARRKWCVNTSGGLGEAETAASSLNVMPREGGNTFSGAFCVSGANGAMQGSNYTQELKDAGLTAPTELLKVYDVNPMGGGRDHPGQAVVLSDLPADRARTTPFPACSSTRTRAIRTPGRCDFDQSRPAFTDALERNGLGRLTWQATPRNKINVYWSEQYNNCQHERAAARATQTPEATAGRSTSPRISAGHVVLAADRAGCCWKPAGARTRRVTCKPRPRIDGTHNDRDDPAQEQGGKSRA